MRGNDGKLSQTTLILRLLCGGYLVYLGVSILLDRTAVPLFMAAAAVFLLAGAGLLIVTLRALLRGREEPEESDREAK